jgi:casein kinase II subunit beta
MASRQSVLPDMVQQPMDDEQFSAPGEGDEIMEEPEEQEDGYCTSIVRIA